MNVRTDQFFGFFPSFIKLILITVLLALIVLGSVIARNRDSSNLRSRDFIAKKYMTTRELEIS